MRRPDVWGDTVGSWHVASSDEHFFEVVHSSHSHILVVRILADVALARTMVSLTDSSSVMSHITPVGITSLIQQARPAGTNVFIGVRPSAAKISGFDHRD
jgi:hypothetical protein